MPFFGNVPLTQAKGACEGVHRHNRSMGVDTAVFSV